MSSSIFKLLFGSFLFALALWSFFIFYHFRTYVIRDDKANRTMTTIFVTGSLVFIVLSLIFFMRIPWDALTLDLPTRLQ